MTELIASKDHVLGGFRVWRRGDQFAARALMIDAEAKPDVSDLKQWLEDMPNDDELEFAPVETVYADFYSLADTYHSAWNVCFALMDFLPDRHAQ